MNRDNPAPVTDSMRAHYYLEELHDLRADPGENTNVIAAHPDLAASFRSKIAAYQHPDGEGSEKLQLDEGSRERLKSLGYLEQ